LEQTFLHKSLYKVLDFIGCKIELMQGERWHQKHFTTHGYSIWREEVRSRIQYL